MYTLIFIKKRINIILYYMKHTLLSQTGYIDLVKLG